MPIVRNISIKKKGILSRIMEQVSGGPSLDLDSGGSSLPSMGGSSTSFTTNKGGEPKRNHKHAPGLGKRTSIRPPGKTVER